MYFHFAKRGDNGWWFLGGDDSQTYLIFVIIINYVIKITYKIKLKENYCLIFYKIKMLIKI